MAAALTTRYAGCRFRSRLEARWAVFFDHLGIEWEYEPQGSYHKNRRLWLLYGPSTAPHYSAGNANWLEPSIDPNEPGCPDAYRAGRSARFEHDEREV